MEAEQALRAARSRILKRISFLSPVLEVVEWREQDGFEGIGTDGRFLLYATRMCGKSRRLAGTDGWSGSISTRSAISSAAIRPSARGTRRSGNCSGFVRI